MRKHVVYILLLISSYGFSQSRWNAGGTPAEDYFIQLPYEEINNKLIVTIMFMGKESRFLFDTGAPTSIYPPHHEALRSPSDRKVKVYDSQGNVDSLFTGAAPELNLNGIKFRNIPVAFLPGDVLSECLDLDGIIGSNLLRNSVVQFDTQNKVIIITDDHKKLKVKRRHRERLRLDKQSSPFLMVVVRGEVGRVKIPAMFDSGFNGFLFFPMHLHPTLETGRGIVESVRGFGAGSLGIFGFEKESKKLRLKLGDLRIGDVEITNAWVQSGSDNKSKLGIELLSSGKLTLDYVNRFFYFEPYQQSSEVMSKFWDFTPLPRDGKVFVGLVWENTSTGIEVGDEVVEVEGMPVDNNPCSWYFGSPLKNKEELEFTFRNKKGETYREHLRKK